MKVDETTMYRRYANSAENKEQRTIKRSSEPTRSGSGENRHHHTTNRRSDRRHDGYHHANHRYERPRRESEHARRHEHEQTHHHEHEHERENEHEHEPLPPSKNNKNPILSFIPSSIYNPESGKILGFLSAEDLLLIAMILIFLDSEEDGDNLMVYALLYVLASEWVDLEKFFTKS